MKTVTALKFENEVQAREVLMGLVNKTVEIPHTGLRVEGTVISFEEDKYSLCLNVEHEGVRWGDQIFTKSHIRVRKSDGWGMDSISAVN